MEKIFGCIVGVVAIVGFSYLVSKADHDVARI